MPRRVGLPGASELFRPTELARTAGELRAADPPEAAPAPTAKGPGAPERPEPVVEHSGRVKHDEKITVYVSSEELIALEQLRLDLRVRHGLAVDRGRIVRAAIASALAAIHDEGTDADVLRRLAGE